MRINFGGEPGHEHKNLTLKIIFLTCLFAGIIIWGAYQASLTSELSVVKLKLPFNDLESLYDSSYRLGVFKKYVDHFLSYLDHLPTSSWHVY